MRKKCWFSRWNGRNHKKLPPSVYCIKTQNKDNFFSLWALATLAGAPIYSSQASHVPTFSNWPLSFFRKLLDTWKKQLRVINSTWDVLWRGQTERGHPWGQRSSSRLHRGKTLQLFNSASDSATSFSWTPFLSFKIKDAAEFLTLATITNKWYW